MSSTTGAETFVWTWLPQEVEPVPAGQLVEQGGRFQFTYHHDYLARVGTDALYAPELPLTLGPQPLPENLMMPGVIYDAAPNAWGRRVMQEAGIIGCEMDYLRLAGSDRIGALDFQPSATEYVPRAGREASMTELLDHAFGADMGRGVAPDSPLLPRVAVGGARPKFLVEHRGGSFIAKLPRYREARDTTNIEYAAMRLAFFCGLHVATTFLEQFAGLDILLVQRFDRLPAPHGQRVRRPVVSGLTMLRLDEMEARYASYEDLARIIARHSSEPGKHLGELFARLCFNVLIGNTDDHARNHAVTMAHGELALLPAFDICPQMRTGGTASQAMMVSGDDRSSRLATCLAAAESFRLTPSEAEQILIMQVQTIAARWAEVCEEARLTSHDRRHLASGPVLNEYCLEGLDPSYELLADIFRNAKARISW